MSTFEVQQSYLPASSHHNGSTTTSNEVSSPFSDAGSLLEAEYRPTEDECATLSEPIAYFLSQCTCYDVLGMSTQVVVLNVDTTLAVAFIAAQEARVQSCLLWDSTQHSFTGVLTATDYIRILLYCENHPSEAQHVSSWTIRHWKELQSQLERGAMSKSGTSAVGASSVLSASTQPVVGADWANVVTCKTTTSLKDCLEQMRQHQVRRLVALAEKEAGSMSAVAILDVEHIVQHIGVMFFHIEKAGQAMRHKVPGGSTNNGGGGGGIPGAGLSSTNMAGANVVGGVGANNNSHTNNNNNNNNHAMMMMMSGQTVNVNAGGNGMNSGMRGGGATSHTTPVNNNTTTAREVGAAVRRNSNLIGGGGGTGGLGNMNVEGANNNNNNSAAAGNNNNNNNNPMLRINSDSNHLLPDDTTTNNNNNEDTSPLFSFSEGTLSPHLTSILYQVESSKAMHGEPRVGPYCSIFDIPFCYVPRVGKHRSRAIYVTMDDPLHKALSLMLQYSIESIAVCSAELIVMDVISQSDLLRMEDQGVYDTTLTVREGLASKISDRIFVFYEKDTLRDIFTHFVRRRVKELFLVDPDTGRLQGQLNVAEFVFFLVFSAT